MLEEIEEQRQTVGGRTEEGSSQNAWGEGGGAVLVACKDERMCLQLQDVVTSGPQEVTWTSRSHSFLFLLVIILVNPQYTL